MLYNKLPANRAKPATIAPLLALRESAAAPLDAVAVLEEPVLVPVLLELPL